MTEYVSRTKHIRQNNVR